MIGLPLSLGLSLAMSAPQSLAGAYEFVPSKTPAKSRGTVKVIFGQTPLLLEPGGDFYYAYGGQSGFWRREGQRLVLVHQGIFKIPFLEPDEVLKKKWPKNEAEGLVLDIRSDGTLSLKGYGVLQGPIVFRRAPRKGTLALIEQSITDEDEITAYSILRSEADTRFEEILDVVLNPKVKQETREWAAIGFPHQLSAARVQRLLDIVRQFPDKTLSDEQARRIKQMIVTALLRQPTDETLEAVWSLRDLHRVRSYHLLEAIGRYRLVKQTAVVDHFLSSDRPEALAVAVETAGKIDHRPALPRVRELTTHESTRVRIEAFGAIARLSGDKSERLSALKNLHRLWNPDDSEYENIAILEAWGNSGLREAVPYLVWCLESQANSYEKRTAATALGELGFPEAVPALINAKNGRKIDVKKPRNEKETGEALEAVLDAALEDADVRKAAIEALWKFDQRARARREAITSGGR